jgi:WD40 repeat protein
MDAAMNPVNSLIPSDKAQGYLDDQENDLLARIPRDVIFQILSHLRPKALSAFSLSGKQFNLILRDDRLWRFLFASRFQIHIPDGTCLQPGDCLEAYKRQHCLHSNFTNGVYATHTLRGHQGTVCSIALGRGSLYSSSSDKTIKIWDLGKNLCIQTLEEHKNWVLSVALSDGELFSGSADGTIKIWDLEKNLSIQTLEGHKGSVYSVALGLGQLFSGSYDDTIKIWDLETNLCIQTLEEHQGPVRSLALGLGKLFSGSFDYTIKIWDLKTYQCLETLKGHEGSVYSIALGFGKLFSGSGDKTIKIWDLETNLCIQTLEGHQGGVSSVALGLGLLFSGSYDNTIKIWDLETNLCIQTLEGHRGCIFSLTLADGKLFSGSYDCTIRIWDFCAPDSAIFEEIAEQFKTNSKAAMERFSGMPIRARNAIYGELHYILNPFAYFISYILNQDMGCAEDAFHDQLGQESTPEQKAKAIKNYLKSVK